MENGAARLIVFGAGVKVDTVSRALWRARRQLSHRLQTSGKRCAKSVVGESGLDAPLKCEGISLLIEALF